LIYSFKDYFKELLEGIEEEEAGSRRMEKDE